MKNSTVTVSLKRYAPFVGSKNHGKRLTVKITGDAAAIAKMFAKGGAVVGSVR